MRKVEKQMVAAIKNRVPFHGRNTAVYINTFGAEIFLHGNHIADWTWEDGLFVNEYTLSRWPSVTTKSRLRALGANVYTKKRQVYLDGKAI